MNLQEQLLKQHREWLTGFNGNHLKKWEDLHNEVPEAALCEAAVRDVMHVLTAL